MKTFGELRESLWANIHKKRQRIKRGSGERMRKPGEKGAPTPAQMKRAKGEEIEEKAPNTADAMKRYKAGKAGFTDIAHLKAKGLIKRADGTKKKSPKYEKKQTRKDALKSFLADPRNPKKQAAVQKAFPGGKATKSDKDKLRSVLKMELGEAKMSPSERDRLDDLLMAYRWGNSSFGFDDDAPNPDKVVKLIKKEFGDKIANQLIKSQDKIKVGRFGVGDRKTPTRITKTGKANKSDLNALKNRLKNKRDWDKIKPKGKLPEEKELNEWGEVTEKAEYDGRPVELNNPTRGDRKKYKVYVRNEKGNVVKVEFGDPNMEIKRDDPARRKSFRARHNCDNPGPKYKARYWSCKFWEKGKTVTDLMKG